MFTSPSQSADSHLLHLVHYSRSACRDLLHQSSTVGGVACIAILILRVPIIQLNLVDLIVLRQKGVVCVPLDLVWAVECGPVILGDWCIQLVPPWQVRVGNPGATIANQVCVVCLNGTDAILAVIPAQDNRREQHQAQERTQTDNTAEVGYMVQACAKVQPVVARNGACEQSQPASN